MNLPKTPKKREMELSVNGKRYKTTGSEMMRALDDFIPDTTDLPNNELANDKIEKSIKFIKKELGFSADQVRWVDDEIKSLIHQAEITAKIDVLDWCRDEVESDIPINVYDTISHRIQALEKEIV